MTNFGKQLHSLGFSLCKGDPSFETWNRGQQTVLVCIDRSLASVVTWEFFATKHMTDMDIHPSGTSVKSLLQAVSRG